MRVLGCPPHPQRTKRASQQAFNVSQEEHYVEVQTLDGYDGVDTRIATALQARAIPDI